MAAIPPHGRARSLWLGWAVAFSLCGGLALANPPEAPTPTENTRRILALVADAGSFKVTEASPHVYQLALLHRAGHSVGVIRLERFSGERPVRVHSRSFAIRVGNLTRTMLSWKP